METSPLFIVDLLCMHRRHPHHRIQLYLMVLRPLHLLAHLLLCPIIMALASNGELGQCLFPMHLDTYRKVWVVRTSQPSTLLLSFPLNFLHYSLLFHFIHYETRGWCIGDRSATSQPIWLWKRSVTSRPQGEERKPSRRRKKWVGMVQRLGISRPTTWPGISRPTTWPGTSRPNIDQAW